MNVAVIVTDPRSPRTRFIVRWSRAGRRVVVPAASTTQAVAVVLMVERRIRTSLNGRPPTLEAEIAAVLSQFPETSRVVGPVPESVTRPG